MNTEDIQREVVTAQEMFEFLERFASDLLVGVAERLSTETAYNLLRGLSYEEYQAVMTKVILGNFGRAS